MKKRICALFAALLLTFCMAGAALAVELPFDTSGDYWLYDPQGLVSQEDTARLEETLDAAGWNHRCGIYILLLPDFTEYGYSDIFEFAQDAYEDAGLGVGDDGDGILLTVSTETRDVSIAVHGNEANRAFTDYGREDVLYDAFLDDFSGGDWGTGIVNFADTCVYLLSEADSGAPVDVPSGNGNASPASSLPRVVRSAAMTCFLPAAVIAFVVCGIMKKKMKTARKADGAAAYCQRRGESEGSHGPLHPLHRPAHPHQNRQRQPLRRRPPFRRHHRQQPGLFRQQQEILSQSPEKAFEGEHHAETHQHHRDSSAAGTAAEAVLVPAVAVVPEAGAGTPCPHRLAARTGRQPVRRPCGET